MNEINTLLIYGSAFDLIEDNSPETLDGISDELTDLIRSLDDYECLRYALLNDDTVLTMDRMTGTVFGTDGLQDFCAAIVREAQESIE